MSYLLFFFTYKIDGGILHVTNYFQANDYCHFYFNQYFSSMLFFSDNWTFKRIIEFISLSILGEVLWYSSPPFIRPPILQRKSDLIMEVAFHGRYQVKTPGDLVNMVWSLHELDTVSCAFASFEFISYPFIFS